MSRRAAHEWTEYGPAFRDTVIKLGQSWTQVEVIISQAKVPLFTQKVNSVSCLQSRGTRL